MMRKGDLLLFYPPGDSKKLRCFEITGRLDSPAFGKLVWGATEPGVVFRHLYGLGTEHPCRLTIDGFNKALGYKPNNTIQGFGVYTLSKAQELIAELDL